MSTKSILDTAPSDLNNQILININDYKLAPDKRAQIFFGYTPNTPHQRYK